MVVSGQARSRQAIHFVLLVEKSVLRQARCSFTARTSFTASWTHGSSTRTATSCTSRATVSCLVTSTCPRSTSTLATGHHMSKMSAQGVGTGASSSPARKVDMYPGSSRAPGKRTDGSGTRRELFVRAKAKKGSAAKGGCKRSPSVPPQPEAFDTSDLRKSIDEVEQQQKRRHAAGNEYVEVDLLVNTAKIHVEQQETLLRQTSSNPWFLFHQDVLALKDAKGNNIYFEYGDAGQGARSQSGPRNGCSTPPAATVCTSFSEPSRSGRCKGTSLWSSPRQRSTRA